MYLGNHAYKIASKQMIDYLDNLINALLRQNIDEGTGPTKSNNRKDCMIWHYITGKILLLSLLKMLIIVALFITANLKHLVS